MATSRLNRKLRYGMGHMGPLTHADLVADLMADFVERQDERGPAAKSDDSRLPHRRAA